MPCRMADEHHVISHHVPIFTTWRITTRSIEDTNSIYTKHMQQQLLQHHSCGSVHMWLNLRLWHVDSGSD